MLSTQSNHFDEKSKCNFQNVIRMKNIDLKCLFVGNELISIVFFFLFFFSFAALAKPYYHRIFRSIQRSALCVTDLQSVPKYAKSFASMKFSTNVQPPFVVNYGKCVD